MTANPEFRIKPAAERDVPLILRMIKGLAEYEKRPREVVADEAVLRKTLFGPRRYAEVLLGYVGKEPVAFAVFFHNYSTFLGRPGLYLEDLFVMPRWRRHGLGTRLLAHVAGLAVARGCRRFEWSALDWNEPAIRFYRALRARQLHEWTGYRLTGKALAKLAGSAKN